MVTGHACRGRGGCDGGVCWGAGPDLVHGVEAGQAPSVRPTRPPHPPLQFPEGIHWPPGEVGGRGEPAGGLGGHGASVAGGRGAGTLALEMAVGGVAAAVFFRGRRGAVVLGLLAGGALAGILRRLTSQPRQSPPFDCQFGPSFF